MDPAQILLFIIIIILTIFLVILGIQVSLILKDLRVTIKKANKVLDDTGEMTENIKQPIIGASQALSGIKAGASLMGLYKKVSDIDKEKK